MKKSESHKTKYLLDVEEFIKEWSELSGHHLTVNVRLNVPSGFVQVGFIYPPKAKREKVPRLAYQKMLQFPVPLSWLLTCEACNADLEKARLDHSLDFPKKNDPMAIKRTPT